MKLKSTCMMLVSLSIISSPLALARDIPGVTRPFEPGNYYSPTAISYPDSTYTPFTMRDLARNGYAVRDIDLNKKSIVIDIKTITEMYNLINQVKATLQTVTGLSGESSRLHSDALSVDINQLASICRSMSGLFSGSSQAETQWRDSFRNVENFSHGDASQFNEKENMRMLEATYKDAARAAALNSDLDNTNKTLLETLAQLKKVRGDQEAHQLRQQIRGLETAIAQKNELLTAILHSVELAHGKYEVDRALKDRKNTKDGTAFLVSDPYHPTSTDTKKFTRPVGQGFIDFK